LPPRNYLHFCIKINDFGLNYCILKENAKDATSGRSPLFSRKILLSCLIQRLHLPKSQRQLSPGIDDFR
jgi:hypothetical protein